MEQLEMMKTKQLHPQLKPLQQHSHQSLSVIRSNMSIDMFCWFYVIASRCRHHLTLLQFTLSKSQPETLIRT